MTDELLNAAILLRRGSWVDPELFERAAKRMAELEARVSEMEAPEDDTEPVTEDWLRSVGFFPRGDRHAECGAIMLSPGTGWLMMAATGRFVHLVSRRNFPNPEYVSIRNKETRGDVRRLCAALGIKLSESAK